MFPYVRRLEANAYFHCYAHLPLDKLYRDYLVLGLPPILSKNVARYPDSTDFLMKLKY